MSYVEERRRKTSDHPPVWKIAVEHAQARRYQLEKFSDSFAIDYPQSAVCYSISVPLTLILLLPSICAFAFCFV